jgi:benzoate-CoA ligase
MPSQSGAGTGGEASGAATGTSTGASTGASSGASTGVAAPGERFNFAAHLIARNSARAAKAAYIDESGPLSYGELALRIRRFAAGLLARGVRREERVLLLMLDCNDWPVAFLGSMYAGIVPVAISTLLTARDYAYMLTHSRAQTALVSAALLPALQAAMADSSHELKTIIVSGAVAATGGDGAAPATAGSGAAALPSGALRFEHLLSAHAPLEAPAPTGPDDPGFWLYSSGSTGKPKGTLHSHANPYWTAELYGLRLLELAESDICFSAAKLFFAYGLGNALSFPLSAGATVLLMGERATPDAVFKRWRGLYGVKPTVFFGSPTGYAGMLASPALPPRAEVALRLASSAGEALPRETGERFRSQFGCDVIDGIGSTEMLHIFISNRPGQVRYGTTGWPVPGYAVELRSDDGRPVPDGEIGDLYIRGPSSALMYWGDHARSKDTFQGVWTRSGDKYLRSADGVYTYAGRSDDMLKVSGMYVSPFEVEATLMQHPSVLEAALVGVADSEGLTKSKAFVVLKPGMQASEPELKSFVKEKLAPYKYPRLIEFIDELPKTATGKIQRYKLREREARRSST